MQLNSKWCNMIYNKKTKGDIKMIILHKDSIEGQIRKTSKWNRVPSFRQYEVRTIEIHDGEKIILKMSSLELFDKYNSIDFDKKLVLKKKYDFKEDVFMIRETENQLFNSILEAKLVINKNQLEKFNSYEKILETKTGNRVFSYVEFNDMKFRYNIMNNYKTNKVKNHVIEQLDELRDKVNKATNKEEIDKLIKNSYITTI